MIEVVCLFKTASEHSPPKPCGRWTPSSGRRVTHRAPERKTKGEIHKVFLEWPLISVRTDRMGRKQDTNCFNFAGQ